jgi:Family of unknown function (DUF5686)/CarboxypepD_reg-like domain
LCKVKIRFTLLSKIILILKHITICLIAVAFAKFGNAQTKIIFGKVLDSATRSPMQNVSIIIKSSRIGGLTDAEGKFTINANLNAQVITFSYTGYQSKSRSLSNNPKQELTILLSKSYTELEDITINAKRGKYHNKNNPAVDLIRLVIANKSKNGPGSIPYSSYEKYEKTRLFTDGPWGNITQNFVLKKLHFFFENTDTTIVPGKSLNSVYLQEILSENFYNREPKKVKKLIVAQKSVNYGKYIDMRGISGALNFLYYDINIYDNVITAFTIQFTSPIANIAPSFYMYFIRDTIVENGIKIVKLYFTPRNPEDLLFRGTLYITLDGRYAVKRVELGISKHANLNYVRNFQLKQDFKKDSGQHYHMAESVMLAFLSPFPKSAGFFGERKITITHFSDSVLADSIFRGSAVDSMPLSSRQTDEFWSLKRPDSLSNSEIKTYTNADSLLKLRTYNRLMDWASLYFVGYKTAGKFDIGPLRTFYSFNSVEGQRLQFGGRTNEKFSSRFFADGYLGYGFKDERFKYKMTGSYSFNNHSIYKFPFNYLQASYLHDIKNPGQEDIFSTGNSFLTSFSRGYNTNWLYSDIFRLSYVHEYENHFSYILSTKYWRQQPAGSLAYVKEPYPSQLDTIPQITTGEISLAIRWAPNEQFFESKVARRSVINNFPVFTFQYSRGIKGLYGGEYNYDAFHFDVFKRIPISPLGFSDVRISASYLAGILPFPLLIIHPANRSYFYSYYSYNLMNVEEFVSDHYAGLNIDHYFNGFFFNKIPLLKKLRLREVIAAKILYGGLRNENNPVYNPNQMLFPTTNGVTSTFSLNGKPYVEASIGIYNIFSFIRVDLIKRFTYTSNPNISTLGLLFSSNFNF